MRKKVKDEYQIFAKTNKKILFKNNVYENHIH